MTATTRIKGYFISLLAWLVLTFFVPVTNALAHSESGWMRICSAYGVHWVEQTDVGLAQVETQADKCQCLSMALVVDVPFLSSTNVFSAIENTGLHVSYLQLTRFQIAQPRSPPASIG